MAQSIQPFHLAQAPGLVDPATAPLAAGPTGQTIRVFPRSSALLNISSFPSPDGTEQIGVVDSGARIVIEGVPSLGTIDIATDRLVIWTSGGALSGLNGGTGAETAPRDVPLEFYMEGNIVFRAGQRVIYANSMYYDVRGEQGVVLDAELLSDVPGYAGIVRLKADVLRQLDRHHFQAHDAGFTSSRLGLPSYWFQADDLLFEDVPTPAVDPTSGAPLFDPTTGQPLIANRRYTESKNNFVYVNGVPVFYWPLLSFDFTNPRTYVRRVRIGQDKVFGTQLGMTLDIRQVLGISERVPNVDWTGSIDYLSKRGVGFGTSVDYQMPRFLGLNGPTAGFFDFWGIHDQGTDNLGRTRRTLVPETENRGRVFWQHRQRLLSGLQITGELGVISDRNFLEAYYENEWDQWKDQATGVELKYLGGHSSWNLATDVRINKWFTQTEWLPKLDQFQLGQPLLEDRLTWFGHSQFGYGRLGIAEPPTDAQDLSTWNLLAWEVQSQGVRIGGRHEIDAPFRVAGVNFVPYALGEVMHWGGDLNGNDNTRLYGQAGIRADLPMWTVDPSVHSTLWNLNGLAHKIVWEAEFLFAEADKNLDEYPLYDFLDDDAIEAFRNRFQDDVFGGMTIPLKFDERYYALRYGMQSWVTGPTEIADDLTLLKLGAKQRWQTKRGLPGQQRIIDWMTLDTGISLFPQADRDNFGAVGGLINYDWRWHLGDRLTLMSDGYADTFDDGLKILTIGSYISRPERGSLFVGLRSIEGPISSNILQTSVDYRMSPKWLASATSLVDFGPAGNIGQIVDLTRIGESFLVTLGAGLDASRGNLGFHFSVEPRFLSLTNRTLVGGVPILPAGARGLE